MFFTIRYFFFLLFLVLAQSQLGFGESDEEEEVESEAQTFVAVSSLLFRPGSDYTVFFTVNPNPNADPLQLKCVIMAKSNVKLTIQSDTIFLRPGESGQISVPLWENETAWRLFAWSVRQDSTDDGYKWEAPHTLIYSSERTNADGLSRKDVDLASVFIQTDKPAYKPEDLVRIRVITMGTNDLPHLTAGVNITITDSQRNVMKKWEQPLELPPSASQPSNVTNQNVALFGEFQKKKNGLSSYEFQLSSEPILGNWTIQVEAGKIKEKMYFDVKKYILPKFQVKIEAPSVLYGTADVSNSATIKASYTYGKGLHGTANVTVSSSYSFSPSTYFSQTKLQNIDVKDGQATVQLTLRSNSDYFTIHTISANVSEENTGRWQIGKATVRVYPQDTYSIQWINKPSSYKPGLPLTVQLKITGADGFPVKDDRKNSLRATFSSPLNVKPKETSIPLSGLTNFTFPTPLQALPANSSFQVQYKKSTFNFTLPNAENATSSGILIEILPPSSPSILIQGHSYNFTIRSNQPIQPEVFHCLLWNDAALEVHGAQSIVNSRKEAATEFPFSLQLPKAAYAELKVFVYFETKYRGSRQIISASKSINTHNYLKIRVSRPIPKKTQAPTADTNDSDDNKISEVDAAATDAPVETTTEEYVDYARDDPGVAEDQEPEPPISDKLQVEPGDAVEIHFETYPDSTIAIRGIDQSLLLLTQQDNDLNHEAVQSKRATSESHQSQLKVIPPDNSTFLKAFRRFGISVLSNERFSAFELAGVSFVVDELEEGEIGGDENVVLDASIIPKVDSRLRTKFPETWLWDEIQSSDDSFTTTIWNQTLPDTLTSWIISGFSLNQQTGLGVASPATITGFMPFFVTLNLPYSVVKYETFDLQVIVHNYLERDVKVFVTLLNRHNDFDFVGSQNNGNRNQTRSVKVEKNHAAVVHFVITPSVLGEMPIDVKAATEDGTARDSMLRHLKVKPDGVRETKSQLFMFDAKTGAGNWSRETSLNIEFPTNVVKGANALQLTVVGNPMGTMTSNLRHLLQLPGGCGEQNMMRLVPNILALHYLTATNSDAKDTIIEAERNLEQGYAHQLKYRKSDGSFAVWADQPGTTWLTSYVLRWFVEAQKYVTIDNNVIKRATEFLLSRQRPDGSFLSLVAGPKYHPELCLYGCNGVALTAYITLTLIQANQRLNDPNLRLAIQNGMKFISRKAVYDLDDNYITNLVAATLMAGNHKQKDRFFAKMERKAKTTINSQGVKVKYWEMKNKRERASSPLAIEMTSYALLAHLWKEGQMHSSVLDIHRWLLNQRNPNGGFISTQDTMMGLTALTAYAIRTKINLDDLQLNIRASGSSKANDTTIVIPVDRRNRMVVQEFPLSANTTRVNVKALGSGPAIIQVTQTWFVPIKNRTTRNPPNHFNIVAKMTIPDPEDPTETELRVCVNSFHVRGARDSIASVQLPSGYIFSPIDYEADSEFMAKRPENIQKFELSQVNTKVDVYYNKVPGHPPTCVSLAATLEIDVANAKNPLILMYEYLNPEVKGQVVYEPAHNITVCQLCKSKGVCVGEECG